MLGLRDRITSEELRTTLKWNKMMHSLRDRRLQWCGCLERMEERAWSSKCRSFKVINSFPKGSLRKIWN